VSDKGKHIEGIPIEGKPSCRNLRFDEADRVTAEWMLSLLEAINPGHKKPNLDKWANTIRLMRERDERTDEQIRQLFTWANQDDFWQTNILSPGKLREQWDQLTLKFRSKQNGNGQTSGSGKGGRSGRSVRDTAHATRPTNRYGNGIGNIAGRIRECGPPRDSDAEKSAEATSADEQG
jgi:hypothetical protein